jgi:peptide subunit release factor 1 (eRF1)
MITSKETVLELSKASSLINGTTLITIGILGHTPKSMVTKHITDELSETNNIKDTNVKNALKTSWRSLYKKVTSLPHIITPPNGMLLCAGEIKSCL